MAKLTYEEILKEAEAPVQPNFSPGPEYADSRRVFQGIPSIERAPGGRLWAAWYAGGQGESPLNYVLLATSANDGESWSRPLMVIDPPGNVRACDPNVWLDPAKRLWLFWMQVHTLHDGRWGVWSMTTDEPDKEHPAWSAPRRLCDGVMLNKPTVLSNGEWLFTISHLPAKVMDNEKRMLPGFLRRNLRALLSPDEAQRIDGRAGACVYVSSDRGATLVQRGCARVPEENSTHNEHMVVEKQDGSLWMLVRTSYGIGSAVSPDSGVSWSPVVATGFPHPSSRFFIRRLASGSILLVKHGPLHSTPGEPKPVRDRLTAYVSADQGRSWQGGLMLEERECTYPDGTQAPDGTIYIIYDHGRRKEKMIMMARFTEKDIMAGKLVSPRSRLRIVVSHATGVIPPAEDWSGMKGRNDSGQPLIFTGI
ncbi:MAG: sialidase family protein [Kiritimatiellia bacterium]